MLHTTRQYAENTGLEMPAQNLFRTGRAKCLRTRADQGSQLLRIHAIERDASAFDESSVQRLQLLDNNDRPQKQATRSTLCLRWTCKIHTAYIFE